MKLARVSGDLAAAERLHRESIDSAFSPQPLRWDKRAMKTHDHLEFMNVGKSEGLTRHRLLTAPTEKARLLLQR